MIQNVLIVDDEPDIRELLEITLGRMNLGTVSTGNLAHARQLLATHNFHLCLTDMKLPDGDGLDLVKTIQTDHPHIPIAVITAHGSTETAITALKSGAFDFVSKPVDLVKLRAMVQSALLLDSPLVHTSDSGTGIVGTSPAIQHLKQQIGKLARNQAPVFISGESGSGKELVARAIHAAGPRKDHDFIAVNCGAIPSELMESEFFGHRKGSFTGAESDKTGLFQAAHGGSLFLDEIADLPLQMQVKLLRAIQEKAIRPVGSQAEIPVDIRLISATHKNLAEEVAKGRVRQDLYYRINVIAVEVPPLRERREDIPLLVEHMLAKIASSQELPKITISKPALAALSRYDYPGNVRELENMLLRACALADHSFIDIDDLPEQATQTSTATTTPINNAPPQLSLDYSDEAAPFSLEKHLEKIERQAIEQALAESRWNRTEAARKLGMSFRALRYRLKKLGLE